MFKSIQQQYMDPASRDKLSSVQKEVKDVSNIMQDSITVTLANTEKTDQLVGQATDLKELSKEFSEDATALKRTMQWRNMKLNVIGIVVVVAIILYILVPILDSKSV
jgi:hypothetical protein